MANSLRYRVKFYVIRQVQQRKGEESSAFSDPKAILLHRPSWAALIESQAPATLQSFPREPTPCEIAAKYAATIRDLLYHAGQGDWVVEKLNSSTWNKLREDWDRGLLGVNMSIYPEPIEGNEGPDLEKGILKKSVDGQEYEVRWHVGITLDQE